MMNYCDYIESDMKFPSIHAEQFNDKKLPSELLVCGYEVRTSCEVSPSLVTIQKLYLIWYIQLHLHYNYIIMHR